MTVQRAAELKPVLLAPLAAGAGPIELDLSAVGEIDSAGVQLLFMLRNAAVAQQRALRLTAISASVAQVFALLGLEGSFGEAAVLTVEAT